MTTAQDDRLTLANKLVAEIERKGVTFHMSNNSVWDLYGDKPLTQMEVLQLRELSDEIRELLVARIVANEMPAHMTLQ